MEEQKRVQDEAELERLFPTYSKDSWEITQKHAKEAIEILFETWEFAVGKRTEEESDRYISAIGPGGEDWDWRHQTLLQTLRRRLEKKEVPANYDFYKDPNPGEVRLLYAPLVDLMVRVSVLQTQYPEAPVLGEILVVCQKTMEMPLGHTSVMQILSCSEHVLEKCQEWEDYASSSVSIHSVTKPLYSLIKHWRELETATWTHLLSQREREYILKDLKLWTAFVVAAESEFAEKQLYEILDEFIRSATMGVFPHRLKALVPYFSKTRVFQHIYGFFSQFKADYEAKLMELTGSAEEHLAEAVKLTKYDMNNHHALKESIKRQQKQLHRLIRGYALALESPFQENVLKVVRQKYIENVLERPIGLLQEDRDESGSEKSMEIESICDLIFERLLVLKEHLGEGQMRHRALQDLFSTLADFGFTGIPDYRQNSSFYSQPVLDSVPALIQTDYSVAETYYYRSVDRLSLLQQLGEISSDLSPQERDKCQGIAINLMLRTMEIRRDVISLVEKRQGKEWVNQVQNTHDKVYFEDLQRFLIGISKEKPTKRRFQSIEEADAFLQENAIPGLSEIRPNSIIGSEEKESLALYRSTAKLTYVLLSLFLSLFHNGFCKADPSSAPAESNETLVQDGTGMAEGTGETDCTKEIEDQEQLQDLQKEGEKEEEPEPKPDQTGEAMEMDADFDGEEESANESGSDADDREGEAEGNEKLLENEEQEMKESSDAEVRETAKPDTTQEGQINSEAQTKENQPEVEDFEFPEAEIDPENQEEASDSDLENPSDPEKMDVEKLSQDSQDAEESVSDSEEKQPPEELKKEENPKKSDLGNESGSDEAPSDDIQMDPRYRNRDFTDYEHEAFGIKDRPANTESLKNKESGEFSEAETVQGSDIISRLKREWKKDKENREKTAEETMDTPQTGGEQDCAPEKIVNQEEAEAADESAGLDSYKFDEKSKSLAAAPADHQEESINPSELSHKKESQLPSSLNDTTPDSLLNKHLPTSSKTDQIPVEEPMNIDLETSGPGFSDSMSGCHTSIRRIDTDPSHDFPIDETAVETDPFELANSDRGKELWDHFQRLTQTAAQELCEQLRIVLEATKANGLQGDYKTGKRINMKKVIGYIASRYRKDKIWLRRTRNTSREYQVLVAIDDSFSMSEHELGTSALKGLCVLMQALQSLEVGELAVARIREGMNLVHSFKDPLTQEKSEWMMGQFRFDFGRNSPADMSYPRFLHQCIDYLSDSGKAELQLVLLITDGRLNKQQVRPWLRKAQNILFLCIIVDNPKSSILSMKSTSFTSGETGPRVTLRPYMEDFPFAHYIVLENPNLLVESMCDVVRQWFDFVKEL